MRIPKQRDIVWIDFDPSKGREITKRRPALIVSDTYYNRATSLCIVCPISSTQNINISHFKLKNYQTTGHVITSQIDTMDIAARQLAKIEEMEESDFAQITQMIQNNFNFKR